MNITDELAYETAMGLSYKRQAESLGEVAKAAYDLIAAKYDFAFSLDESVYTIRDRMSPEDQKLFDALTAHRKRFRGKPEEKQG